MLWLAIASFGPTVRSLKTRLSSHMCHICDLRYTINSGTNNQDSSKLGFTTLRACTQIRIYFFLFKKKLNKAVATYRRVNVCRGCIVRIRKHRDHRNDDGLDTDNWPPALLCCFLFVISIFSGGMQNRDANLPVLVYCRKIGQSKAASHE